MATRGCMQTCGREGVRMRSREKHTSACVIVGAADRSCESVRSQCGCSPARFVRFFVVCGSVCVCVCQGVGREKKCVGKQELHEVIRNT